MGSCYHDSCRRRGSDWLRFWSEIAMREPQQSIQLLKCADSRSPHRDKALKAHAHCDNVGQFHNLGLAEFQTQQVEKLLVQSLRIAALSANFSANFSRRVSTSLTS